jgi:major membrane immunogen (membrane-anchored lipoprotein)
MKLGFNIVLLILLAAAVGFAGGAEEKPQQAMEPEPKEEVQEEPRGPYEDGIYFAMEDSYTRGWKYVVTLEVENGFIVEADWNGVNSEGGPTKDVISTSGKYPLVELGGGQAPWHIQGERSEAWLIEKQDPSLISYIDDEGHTDTITGVSIHVVEFFDLAKQALDAGPVGRGMYRDGYYSATMPEFDRGFKYFVEITVVNGYIAAVDWDAFSEEDERTKDEISEAGEYPMVENAGAQAPWHEQGANAENYLIETQDPTRINYSDDEGHTDAITGVSINVGAFFQLAERALAWAK